MKNRWVERENSTIFAQRIVLGNARYPTGASGHCVARRKALLYLADSSFVRSASSKALMRSRSLELLNLGESANALPDFELSVKEAS